MNKIRLLPGQRDKRKELILSFAAAAIGFLLGLLAKYSDSISAIGDIGTHLGFWVFAGTLLAGISPAPFSAARNVLLFFLAMLAAYYLYGHFVLGFFPFYYFLGWLFIALLSPVGGMIVWLARGQHKICILLAALPVSLLLAEGYPAYYTFHPALILDLILGIILAAWLPRKKIWKIYTLLAAGALAFFIVQLHLFSYLP